MKVNFDIIWVNALSREEFEILKDRDLFEKKYPGWFIDDVDESIMAIGICRYGTKVLDLESLLK